MFYGIEAIVRSMDARRPKRIFNASSIGSMSPPDYSSAQLLPSRADFRFIRYAQLKNRLIHLRSHSSQTQLFFYSRQHESDTERETSVPRIERCAASSKGKEAGTVHRLASPRDRGMASGKLFRLEAESGTRSRWCTMAGVCSRNRGSTCRST